MTIASQFFNAGRNRRFADIVWPPAWSNLPLARLQSITERERAEYERELLDKKSQLDQHKLLLAKCQLIVRVVVDLDGNPVFTADQIPQLMQTDSALTNAVYSQCRAHCGFDEDDIERLVGNFATTKAADSPSDLPLPPVEST